MEFVAFVSRYDKRDIWPQADRVGTPSRTAAKVLVVPEPVASVPPDLQAVPYDEFFGAGPRPSRRPRGPKDARDFLGHREEAPYGLKVRC